MGDWMRALVNTANPDQPVEIRDVPEPSPAPNEVLVEVRAMAINRGELRLIASRPDGWRPGQDIAGVVARAAADGSGPHAGDRVVAMVDQAGWSERAAAPISRLAVIPDNVSFEAAATLPVAGLTALRALRVGGPLLGRRVMVTGAAGGVGHFATQLASRAGARVTGIVSRAARGADLGKLPGVSLAVDYDDLEGPFDLILESVGGASLAASIRSVTENGDVVVFGNSSGEETPLSFRDLRGLARVHAFHVYATGEPPTFGEDLGLLASLIGNGDLQPRVGYQGSWNNPRPALDALRDREIEGKAVLQQV
jgi:NADPH:quinone reductase-like Zn-dependent oxidoreductase